MDAELRDLTAEREGIRARVNSISKEVGQARRDGDVATAERLQDESRELGSSEKELGG